MEERPLDGQVLEWIVEWAAIRGADSLVTALEEDANWDDYKSNPEFQLRLQLGGLYGLLRNKFQNSLQKDNCLKNFHFLRPHAPSAESFYDSAKLLKEQMVLELLRASPVDLDTYKRHLDKVFPMDGPIPKPDTVSPPNVIKDYKKHHIETRSSFVKLLKDLQSANQKQKAELLKKFLSNEHWISWEEAAGQVKEFLNRVEKSLGPCYLEKVWLDLQSGILEAPVRITQLPISSLKKLFMGREAEFSAILQQRDPHVLRFVTGGSTASQPPPSSSLPPPAEKKTNHVQPEQKSAKRTADEESSSQSGKKSKKTTAVEEDDIDDSSADEDLPARPTVATSSRLQQLAPPLERSRFSSPGQPRTRLRWTEEEVEALGAGVAKFGVGNWERIRRAYETHLQNRSSVDLKDKWRQLSKSKNA